MALPLTLGTRIMSPQAWKYLNQHTPTEPFPAQKRSETNKKSYPGVVLGSSGTPGAPRGTLGAKRVEKCGSWTLVGPPWGPYFETWSVKNRYKPDFGPFFVGPASNTQFLKKQTEQYAISPCFLDDWFVFCWLVFSLATETKNMFGLHRRGRIACGAFQSKVRLHVLFFVFLLVLFKVTTLRHKSPK